MLHFLPLLIKSYPSEYENIICIVLFMLLEIGQLVYQKRGKHIDKF